MGVNINFKREFTVNTKKYNSIDEMPDDPYQFIGIVFPPMKILFLRIHLKILFLRIH